MTWGGMRPRHRAITRLYLVLLGGLMIVSLVAQPGMYSGALSGQIDLQDPEIRVCFLKLSSDSARAWFWIYRGNHKYRDIDITIVGDEDRQFQVDLVSQTWHCGEQSGPLSAESLYRLIFTQRDNAAADSTMLARLDAILEHFRQMAKAHSCEPAITHTTWRLHIVLITCTLGAVWHTLLSASGCGC